MQAGIFFGSAGAPLCEEMTFFAKGPPGRLTNLDKEAILIATREPGRRQPGAQPQPSRTQPQEGAAPGRKKKKRSAWGVLWRFCVVCLCLVVMIGSVGAVLVSLYVVDATASDGDLLNLDNLELAKTSTYTRIFDVNAARFSAPQDMRAEIHTALAETGEAPAMDADLINSVYHSLAYCYGEAYREMEAVTGQHWDKLYIAGGGAKNATLNELTAHYTGKQVVALPIEATAIGNLKIQMNIQ